MVYQGLKLRVYYSLLDWSNENYHNHTRTKCRYDIRQNPERWEMFCRFNFGQHAELNNTSKPDLYWFDGDWELCYTINDSWGYQPPDTNVKTPQMLLCTFVDCLGKGGNLLMDIVPKADGTIPQEEIEILKAFGRWTSKHQEAIYKTRADIPGHYFNGYTTLNKAGDILYLDLPYKPIGRVPLKGVLNGVKDIRVVGSNTKLAYKVYNKLSWSEVPGIIYIDLVEAMQDPNIKVIAVELNGPLKCYASEGQVITSN